jgi:hypothetical protein
MLLRKLQEDELTYHLGQLQQDIACLGGSIDNPEVAKYQLPAQIEFPLGELTNPAIQPLILIWSSQNAIRLARIQKKDQFDAQGLEGKCIVSTTVLIALTAARVISPYRRTVSVCLDVLLPNLKDKDYE